MFLLKLTFTIPNIAAI